MGRAERYTILIKESAQRELADLPKKQRGRVEQRIEGLSDEPLPSGVVALQGKRFHGLYRIRCGNYRIIYQVQLRQLLVLVVKIGHRRDVYA